MSKVEDIIAATKLNELINKKEESSQSRTVLWVLAIVGAVDDFFNDDDQV